MSLLPALPPTPAGLPPVPTEPPLAPAPLLEPPLPPIPGTPPKDRLALPGVLLPILQARWHAQGRPASGPVFPVRKGPRAGKRKSVKNSYAKRLREALWQAGIVRPLAGFHEAESEEARRALCLIQSGSEHYLPLDMHSFRRAYNTGLARAGVNVQTTMKLAAHRNPSTHMRYVLGIEHLQAPSDALPTFLALPTAKLREARSSNQRILSVPGKNRTYDLRFRKALLYPTELRGRARHAFWGPRPAG